MTREEETIRQMLKDDGAVLVRQTGGHEMWRLSNKRLYAIRAASRKNGDPRGWKNTLAAFKRVLAGQDARRCKVLDMPTTVVPQAEGTEDLVTELNIEVKGTKRVVTELLREVRLAPHQVQGLLRKAGIEVPDEATIEHTDGYTVVSWTDIQETMEDI